jgi:hypothetical protein
MNNKPITTTDALLREVIAAGTMLAVVSLGTMLVMGLWSLWP